MLLMVMDKLTIGIIDSKRQLRDILIMTLPV